MNVRAGRHAARRAPGPVFPALLRIAVVMSIVLLSGCDLAGGEGGDVVAGVDLDELFAPATDAEIAAADDVWADRDVAAASASVAYTGELSHSFAPGWTADVRVVAHEVDGTTHYGAIVTPQGEADAPRPVLLYLHGGDAGVDMSEVAQAMAFSPVIRDQFVVVVPSFRSEPLYIQDAAFVSGGAPSPWDRDVDDTLALLNVALETTPDTDPDRIVALGFSRGSTVGLLAAIRDERIGGVVEFFGATDFLGAFARDVTRDMLEDNLPDLPGISSLNTTLLEPLQGGDLTIDAVRRALIRRSPVYYVDRIPDLQIHHGLADPVVPASEGRALAEAFDAAGRTDHEAYFYEGGVHSPISLNGALDRVTEFLQQWTTP